MTKLLGMTTQTLVVQTPSGDNAVEVTIRFYAPSQATMDALTRLVSRMVEISRETS